MKVKVIVKAKVKEKVGKNVIFSHPHKTHKTVTTNFPYTYPMILIMEDVRSHADTNV